jgi:hypothetical protein
VDLLRRFRKRRVEPDGPPVRLIPVREPAQAGPVIRSAGRRDLRAEHVGVLGERRAHIGLDDAPDLPAPGVRVPNGRRRRQTDQWILADRLGEPPLDLLDRPVDREPRRDAMPAQPRSVPFGEVHEHPPDAAQLLDHRVGHLGRRHAELRQVDRQHDLRPADRIDAELRQPHLEEVGSGGGVPDDDLAADPLLGVEAVLRQRLGAAGERAVLGHVALLGRGRHVLELVREPVVAPEVRARGPRSLAEVVVLGSERVDRVGHGSSGRGVGRPSS